MTAIEVKLIDSMGSDLSVVNAARVSFGKKSEWETHTWEYWDNEDEEAEGSVWYTEKELSERDAKLIKYLAEHKHLSPFGHAFASFHVRCPIFSHAQLEKHEYLRVNTVSRRYVTDEPEFYTPDVWRTKADDVKQGSSDKAVDMYTSMWGFANADEDYCALMRDAVYLYEHMVKSGIAPEMARMVLPQSAMTEFYWSGSLDAFAKMCRLRCAPDTQLETRLVANPISDVMAELFPVSWEALMIKEGGL